MFTIITEYVRKVDFLWEKAQNDMIANLLKQKGKIEKDPTDVKFSDVEKAVSEYENIENKTEEIISAYDVVLVYYNENK